MFIENLFRGVIGIALILGIAYLLSNNRKKLNFRLITGGIILQIIFAILVIKGEQLRQFFFIFGWPQDIFKAISSGFVAIMNFSSEGAKFIFGNLGISPGFDGSMGFFFAFQVLPTIIFFASLMSVLYYLGVMQKIVQGMAWVMARVMGTSGAESLSCTANIFVGQTEAPLMIRPFLKDLTRSELLTVMVGGMATIAGGVMAAYIQILASSLAAAKGIPIQQAQIEFATHLLGASVMAAPAALLISKIIYPETEDPVTRGTVKVKIEKNAGNVLEAASAGAADGLGLALNVGAMLIAFIALIALVNALIMYVGDLTGMNTVVRAAYKTDFNFQFLLGWILQWLAYGIGVPSADTLSFGGLVGTKLVLNEFVAYMDFGTLIQNKVMITEKAIIMATYALCGFANFSSIAIQLGGIGALAPERKSDLASLGIKAVIGGTLATLMTATLAGILY
ncbi:MAG: NupC/NupG family nucleoside CNT transporter [Ignavibacteriaceae bacterium]|nr:NupC/NupG family nucleoside CNT transporter [Ignavibacteriaceae bacterium]